MPRILPALLVFFLVLLGSVSGPRESRAGTTTNREIAQIRARWHLTQKERSEAIAVLREHLLEDADDDAALLLLGLVLLEDGRTREAGDYFRKAAAVTQGERRVISLYNLADSYFRAGQIREAGDALRLAASGKSRDIDQPLRDHLLSVAARLDSGDTLPPYRRPVPSRFGMTALMGSGFDTNVLLASDASLAATADTGTSSFQLSPGVQLAWHKPVGLSERALLIGASGSFSWNASEEAQAFNSLVLGQTLDWTRVAPSSSGFSLGNQLDLVLLNTDGLGFFNLVETVRPRYQFRHSARASTDLDLGIRYQLFAAPADPDFDRTGPGVRPRLVHRHILGPTVLTAGVAYDLQFASGREFKASSLQVPLSLAVPRLWRNLGVVVSGEFASTQYGESTTERADTLLQGALGLRLPWSRRSLLGLDVAYRKNTSTLESASYSKQQFVLTFSQDLF
jgi:tetratricopeptide (TPR) repeat protein